MPWNEPGNNNNNQDPWGGKRDQNPPDLDKIIGNFIRKLRALFLNKKESGGNNSGGSDNGKPSGSKELGYIVGALAGGLLVLWFLSGFFIVNPAEETVILRFGQYTSTMQSGLH